MAYQAEISRENPTCILFVIDQSGSMDEITDAGRSKAAFVADVLNKTLYTLITSCSKSDGVRNYFDVGVIAYAGTQVMGGFGGALSGDIVHPIQAISENTLRVEERKKKVDDGAGGIVELKTKFPVWFDPKSEGGTPMRAALGKTIETGGRLVRSSTPALIRRPFSTSPTVNRPMARPRKWPMGCRRISTKDGQALLFNLHVNTGAGPRDRVPDRRNRAARRVFADAVPHVEPAACASGKVCRRQGLHDCGRVARLHLQRRSAMCRRLLRDRHPTQAGRRPVMRHGLAVRNRACPWRSASPSARIRTTRTAFAARPRASTR